MNRIPRPKHITNLSLNYQKTKDPTIKKQLLQTLLSQYVTNGFQINGHPLSLQDLSFKYNVPIQDIYKEIQDISKTVTGFIKTDDLLSAHEGLLAMTLESVIRDKGLVASQLQRLLQSQGDTYKPFISAEVNQALKTTLSATKNMIDLTNSFIPKNTEIVNLIADKKKDNQLTVDEALETIRQESKKAMEGSQQGSLPPKPGLKALPPKDLKQIFEDHNLAEMPEVRANPSDEQENMINVKAARIIEDTYSEDKVSEEFIHNVEDEWEEIK